MLKMTKILIAGALAVAFLVSGHRHTIEAQAPEIDYTFNVNPKLYKVQSDKRYFGITSYIIAKNGVPIDETNKPTLRYVILNPEFKGRITLANIQNIPGVTNNDIIDGLDGDPDRDGMINEVDFCNGEVGYPDLGGCPMSGNSTDQCTTRKKADGYVCSYIDSPRSSGINLTYPEALRGKTVKIRVVVVAPEGIHDPNIVNNVYTFRARLK